MSEYQYYEFRALDQSLTPEEQQAVASLSSRVWPHPRRAIFVYNYSDFPANPLEVLAQYYDAMFYIANWGSCQLAFRFPAALVEVDTMQRYTVVTTDYPSDAVTISVKDDTVILSLSVNEQEFDWVEGEDWLDEMIGLREALIQGDYRVLYLAWLKGIAMEYGVDKEALEPPVPPGLRDLTPALESFVECFDVPVDLIAIAAERSPALKLQGPNEAMLRQRIAALSLEEKDAFLLRLARDEPRLSLVLREHLGLLRSVLSADTEPRRTVGDLLAA